MEETCVIEPALNTEDAVPKEPQGQLCIDASFRENVIGTDVGTFISAKLNLEEVPDVK